MSIKAVIYVDSANGSDSYAGEIDSPYQTLAQALSDVGSNGIIVLQNGTYAVGSFGDITKNVTIQAAYGATSVEVTDSIHYSNAQGMVRGITFNTGNITVDNGGFGGIAIRECNFNGPDNPIVINSANYVSIHQNRFYDYLEAIRITTATEMTVSANYFYNGYRAIYITDIEWLDLYQNTIYGASDTGGGGIEDINLRVVYIAMNPTRIARKAVSLPSFSVANSYGYDVAVNVVNGPSQEYGKDYTVINGGITVSWGGLGLDGALQSSDILRIMYSEGPSPVSGDAISAYNIGNRNSRVDSNNINDASVGVVFSDEVRIRYNNFAGTVTEYSGTPTEYDGNFSGAPDYVDASSGNFKLKATSANIDNADPQRWDTILQEMGIGIVGGHYTGISAPTGRAGITPFNRNVDKDGQRRLSRNRRTELEAGVTGRSDVGSYEYPITGTNPETESYISEDGFDLINPGSITGPFASVDRGFTGLVGLQVQTNPLGRLILNPDGTHVGVTGIGLGATGLQYSRYSSKNIDMDALALNVGSHNRSSIAFFYPSFPSNTPTGAYVGPPTGNLSGDTGSRNNPYRTIDEAIAENPTATTIYVKPGIYPAFDGAAGKKLVGIREVGYPGFNQGQYGNLDDRGWTGTSEAVLGGSYLAFDVGAGLTGTAESEFRLVDNIYVRFNMDVVDDEIEFRIYNGLTYEDSNYILVRKKASILTIQHRTGGVSYTASTPSSDMTYKVTVRVLNENVIVTIVGQTTNITKAITLDSSYTGPWTSRVSYTDVIGATGTATGAISKFIAKADLVTDVGITGTTMARKIFGIIGERGLSGLYSLYGD